VSWTRRIRILWQGTFLALFLWLLERLAAGDGRAFRTGALHESDPLSAISLALADGGFPVALLLAAALLLLTLVLGRFFCGWVCPLGTLQQLSSWILTPRTRRESLEVNRLRPWHAWKYALLAFLLALALLGSTQAGLLDPLSLLARGLASGVWPAALRRPAVPGGVLAFALLLGVLLASRWVPRFFCRALCPLGALLGVFGRFALFRIARGDVACTDCRRLRRHWARSRTRSPSAGACRNQLHLAAGAARHRTRHNGSSRPA
jgi:polyferredoxin